MIARYVKSFSVSLTVPTTADFEACLTALHPRLEELTRRFRLGLLDSMTGLLLAGMLPKKFIRISTYLPTYLRMTFATSPHSSGG
jgi:hypothetical protein